MNDDRDITPIEIDLGVARRDEMNESFLRMFGWAIEKILGRMFDGGSLPVKIKGNPKEISAFAQTIGRDKKYMQAVAKYGLNDPRVYKDKFKLRKAIANFERTTGIKYPFKG